MRPIEPAPVKHCLPLLKTPGSDRGDMARTHTHTNTQESADTQVQPQTITGLAAIKPEMLKTGQAQGCLSLWW